MITAKEFFDKMGSLANQHGWDSPAALLEALPNLLAKLEKCTWFQEDEGSDIWVSDCGGLFTLNEGSPADNDLKYCCWCGKSIVSEPYVVEKEGE